jgi:hypothetical protein
MRMGYILTLIALLIAFVWVTPARMHLTDTTHAAIGTVRAVIASGSAPFQARIESLADSVQQKAMELLRKELHRSVDDLVK